MKTEPFAVSLIPALVVVLNFALLTPGATAATFSLARDFSYSHNGPESIWSYRMDDFPQAPPSFPLLPSARRDANELWGSDFPTPPRMWSDEDGYWGIGRNDTGRELSSNRNGTKWAAGEVLFHPKAGPAPARLVIGWRAPSNLVARISYTFGRAAEQGNSIGYEILHRHGALDTTLVALGNIGASLTNKLGGIVMDADDQLFFRFHNANDPSGDISRVNIEIDALSSEILLSTPQPGTAELVEGSAVIFRAPAASTSTVQWLKDGQPLPGETNLTLRIPHAKAADAAKYSLTSNTRPGAGATLQVIPKPARSERFRSLTPQQVFATTRAEQEMQLRTNQLMQRFAQSRQRMAHDRYRPAYHFVSPESQLNDPNGLCYWQGLWHMFYQAYPPDEFPESKDISKRRQHWGHAVSKDLVVWRDLPYAIYPGLERMCFSGSTLVESNQVVAFYPGIGAGQMVAIAKDPLLLNWEKIADNPVIPGGGDSCIWKEGSTYLGLIGRGLWSSSNLVNWVSHGEFYSGVEGSCPNFLPIGNKHIVLSFSHALGGQYLLGDYDPEKRRFKSYQHARFNHGMVSPGGVHAPSAASDGAGGVINILNINDGRHSDDWDQIMSLAQHLTLGADRKLRIEPVAAVKSLRTNHQHVSEMTLPANQDIVLETIRGNALELELELDPKLARWVQLNVLRSPNAEEQTSLTFYNFDRKLSIWYDTKAVLCLDGTRSSISPDAWLRPPERIEVESAPRDWGSAPTDTTPGKTLHLRVFIDRSVVEVFVNGRQYMAQRVYPHGSESVGVALRAQGQDAVLKKLDAWQMNSITALEL